MTGVDEPEGMASKNTMVHHQQRQLFVAETDSPVGIDHTLVKV